MLPKINDLHSHPHSTDVIPLDHPSPKLPVELWFEVIEHLNPADCVALVTATHQKQALLAVPALMRRVMGNSQLINAYDPEHSGDTRRGVKNPWSVLQSESRLLHRLEQGPIPIPCSVFIQELTFSPNMLHLLALDEMTGEHSVVPLTGDGRPKLSFTASTAGLVVFGPGPEDLLVCESKNGPVWVYDLSCLAVPRRQVAPREDVAFSNLLPIPKKNAFMALTMHGFLHTYEANTGGTYEFTRRNFLAGGQVDLQMVSSCGDIVIWNDKDNHQLRMVELDVHGGWREMYARNIGGCCEWLRMSPRGKSATIGVCGSIGLTSFDRRSSVAERVTRWFNGHPKFLFTPDESTVFVRDKVAMRSFGLPQLDKECVFSDGEVLPVWLENYEAQEKEHIFLTIEARDGTMYIEKQNDEEGHGCD